MTVTKPDGTVVLSADRREIDMWREDSEYVRPKWGIYRSLADKENLNPGEDVVYFTNFSVQKNP